MTDFARPKNHIAWIGTIYNKTGFDSIKNYVKLSTLMGTSSNVLWKIKELDNYTKAVVQYLLNFVAEKQTSFVFVNDYVVVSTFKTKKVYEILGNPINIFEDIELFLKTSSHNYRSDNDHAIIEYVNSNIVCLETVSAFSIPKQEQLKLTS